MTCKWCKGRTVTRTAAALSVVTRRRQVLQLCPTCDLDAALDVITHPSNNRPRGEAA